MDKFNFLQIIQNPKTLNANMLDDLLDIAENYPYFQGVYALLSKLENNPHNTNQAAIRTANRNILKFFLEVNPEKINKRELIDSLNLHTEQINAFDKFENLEKEETQTELLDENQLYETKELIDEHLSIEKEDSSQKINEENEEVEKIEKNRKTDELGKENIEKSNLKSEEDNLPVFDEPSYLSKDTDLDIQVSQIDTAKDLPDYEENTNKGNFFDDISDTKFPEVNFDDKEFDFKKTKSFFDEVEEKLSEQHKIETKPEQEAQKNKLHYTDFHLEEGEILPPDIKITSQKTQRSSKSIQYEDYHLTAPQQEAKIIESKISTKDKINNKKNASEIEKNDKPTGSFFDSF